MFCDEGWKPLSRGAEIVEHQGRKYVVPKALEGRGDEEEHRGDYLSELVCSDSVITNSS